MILNLLGKTRTQQCAKKTNKVLGFLRKNIKDCPEHVKHSCYKTLFRPILEYGCVVWDPHNNCDIESIETIQKSAERFITGSFTLLPGNTKLNMNKLDIEPLEERRARIKLNTLFKTRNDQLDIPLNHISLNRTNTRSGK